MSDKTMKRLTDNGWEPHYPFGEPGGREAAYVKLGGIGPTSIGEADGIQDAIDAAEERGRKEERDLGLDRCREILTAMNDESMVVGRPTDIPGVVYRIVTGHISSIQEAVIRARGEETS